VENRFSGNNCNDFQRNKQGYTLLHHIYKGRCPKLTRHIQGVICNVVILLTSYGERVLKYYVQERVSI